MPTSREALSVSIGRVLFLRLSKEDAQQLFKDAGNAPDWKLVAHYTRQVVRSPEAAATIATHFVSELAVLNSALEPQMYLCGASMCVADLVCYVALIASMHSLPDAHRFALCSVSRWFDHMQHAVDALSPPPALGTSKKVTFNYDMPDPPPTIASLPVLVGPVGAAAAEPQSTGGGGGASAAAPVDVSDKGGAAAGGGGKSAAREKKDAEKAAKKAEKAAAAPPPPAAAAEEGQSDVSKLDIRVGMILSAERHPEAEKLYVEKVDVGEGAPRTVVSGLVDFMPASDLTNRRAVLRASLASALALALALARALALALGFATHPRMHGGVRSVQPQARQDARNRVSGDGAGRIRSWAHHR